MKRLLAVAVLAASLGMQACSGNNAMTPAAPYQPGATNVPMSAAAPMEPNAPMTANAPQDSNFTSNAAGAALPGIADGVAYAEYTSRVVSGKTVVVSGPLADAPLACGTQGANGQASLPAIQSPWVTSKGSALSTFTSSVDGSGNGKMLSQSSIDKLSVLKGFITADNVKAVAESDATKTSGTSTAAASAFTNLVINGKKVASPKPNTTRYLNHYGYVVLNEVVGPVNNQKNSGGALQTSVLVNMMRIVINVQNNPLKIPVGTTIIVGNAYSSFVIPPAPYKVDSTSYSLYANGLSNKIGNFTGPWTSASVSCNTYSDTNSTPLAKTPVGSVNNMSSSANATTEATKTVSQSSSSTGTANLLNSLIVANTLNATSTVTRNAGKFTSTGSISFKSLTVNGTKIDASVKANTKMQISGLGYAMINEQYITPSKTGRTEEVNAVHIYVTVAGNKYNLATGSQVVLGHAHAEIDHT